MVVGGSRRLHQSHDWHIKHPPPVLSITNMMILHGIHSSDGSQASLCRETCGTFPINFSFHSIIDDFNHTIVTVSLYPQTTVLLDMHTAALEKTNYAHLCFSSRNKYIIIIHVIIATMKYVQIYVGSSYILNYIIFANIMYKIISYINYIIMCIIYAYMYIIYIIMYIFLHVNSTSTMNNYTSNWWPSETTADSNKARRQLAWITEPGSCYW